MASLVYNRGKKEIMDNSIDLINDTIKAMLVTSGYVANADDNYIDEGGANDPVDHELSGTGYTLGGVTLTSKTITQNDTDDRGEFDTDDLLWTAIDAGTAAGVIIYKSTGTPTTSTLIEYIDAGGFPVTTNGTNFTITLPTAGILHHS